MHEINQSNKNPEKSITFEEIKTTHDVDAHVLIMTDSLILDDDGLQTPNHD